MRYRIDMCPTLLGIGNDEGNPSRHKRAHLSRIREQASKQTNLCLDSRSYRLQEAKAHALR